jgi:fibronectin type 3 domain-containing protein/TolB-like protein
MRAFAVSAMALAGGLALLSGCMSPEQAYFLETESSANVYVAPVQSSIRKLAILPFKAETELIGGSVSDMFVTELLRAGRYELVERSQMAKVLGESELALSGLSDARAAEVASLLGADGVVIGTVDEYGTVAVGGHPYPQVGISVRMIDIANGKIMWSADLAKRASSKSAILSAFARSIVHELAAGMYRKWGQQRYAPGAAAPASPAATAPATVVSEMAPALPPPPPQKPAFALSDMGLREVTISWTEPAARAAEYIIERAAAKEGPFQVLGRVPASRLTYRDAGTAQAPLADCTVYFYRLSSVSADGQKSDPSTVRESMTAPPPDPPKGLKASAPSPRAVKVVWDAAPAEACVREYRIERAVGDADTFLEAGRAMKPEFQEGGTRESPLADNTLYRYRVKAVNKVGSEGDWSEPAVIETLPPPRPVEGLKAGSGGVRCVPLSWTALADPFVVRYEVQRSDGPDGEFRKIGTVKASAEKSFVDGGREPGSLPDQAAFWYRLVAVNTVESESAPCAPVTAVTRAPPPAVEGVTAEGGLPRMARVAWTKSADEKAAGYKIQRSALMGEFEEVGAVEGRDTAAFEDRGRARRQALGTLGDGTTYLYRVQAYNIAKATGAWSRIADATTKPAPAAPAGLGAESGLPRRIDLAWLPNREADVDHYVVEWSKDGQAFKTLQQVPAGENPVFSVKELENRETRHFRVKAVDRDTIESGWSPVKTAATKPAPPVPQGLTAENGVLAWDKPDVPDVAGYSVWQKGLLLWSLLGTADKPEFKIPEKLAGKKITVAVTVKDADGLESERSAPTIVAPVATVP